ncbi:MAG TPA: EI24 domain-containing protein, partial [Pseudomonadales bacterium]|nr:EI24 domain-containing protein [Pseudomonadales bacterium]
IRALGLGVISLVLMFIPGVNMINPVLWAVFGAWVMALQYIDIVADNNGQPFNTTLEIMRQRRYLTLGFGGVVLVLTTVPVINLFIIPVAVAAAVKLWVDVMQSQTMQK